MSDSGHPKDLRLVKPDERIDPAELDEAIEALRALVDPAPLGDVDHEALLALTLGDDVSAIAAEEREQAEALRLALDRGGARHPLADLAAALRALHVDDGQGLSGADHEVLLAVSLGEAVPLSEQERSEAESLRHALEGRGSHPLASLAAALRASAGQLRDLDPLGHERILRRALRVGVERARSGRVAVVAAIVTLAAAVALFVGSFRWLETLGGEVASRGPAAGALDPSQLAVSRSTQELFDPLTPFPTKGGESERMGRIVTARASDLRANRFAAWGVR